MIKNSEVINGIISILKSIDIPTDIESSSDSFNYKSNSNLYENAYLGIVAICHQTTPLGERPLQGIIEKNTIRGWDYLKHKFLIHLNTNPQFGNFNHWSNITPLSLSKVFYDNEYGLTLNRINERTSFLNELGVYLSTNHVVSIKELFNSFGNICFGSNGFFNFMMKTKAFQDPTNKKITFFLEIMKNSFNWIINDYNSLKSPIDYHEIRGHLRIGTIKLEDTLNNKITLNLPLSIEEDNQMRLVLQDINNEIAFEAGITNSQLHYFFWNIFRNCCSSNPKNRHCKSCGEKCTLPARYNFHTEGCIFKDICKSFDTETAIIEPAYVGHYY